MAAELEQIETTTEAFLAELAFVVSDIGVPSIRIVYREVLPFPAMRGRTPAKTNRKGYPKS